MTTVAIVPAAGQGRRLGADKALLDLGGEPAIQRLCRQCLQAGVDRLLVVRARGAAPLPALPEAARTVEVDGGGEMADSLRAALPAVPLDAEVAVVLPVDHALVPADTIAAVAAIARLPGVGIAVPLFRQRPGHPVALRRAVFAELRALATLRDVVRRDPARVRAIPTGCSFVLADLDEPADVEAARAALAAGPFCVVEQMRRHRSRRAYAPTPLAAGQLERLVDAARHASTSSFIQAYAVVAVADAARRRQIARLCGDQAHVAEAPLFLAVCADLHKLELACAGQGRALQAQSLELFLQAAIDAALLGQNLQLAAESEGLGTCMIGGARNHPVELAALLGLPPHACVLFGMTIGHATDDPLPRPRMPLAGVLHRETYDACVLAQALAGADAAQRQWAQRSNAERGGLQGRRIDEHKGWAERMAVLAGETSSYLRARTGLRAELRQLGFGLE